MRLGSTSLLVMRGGKADSFETAGLKGHNTSETIATFPLSDIDYAARLTRGAHAHIQHGHTSTVSLTALGGV